MPSSERFAAELIFETRQLKTGIREAGRALKDFEGETSRLFSQFGQAAETNIKKVTKELSTLNAVEVGQQLQEFAATGTRALQNFLGAADQVDKFRLTLTTLTGSASQAEKELKKLQDFAGRTPFELQDVVAAGIQIRSLGVDVDRFLPLAGDLASVFNRDIKDSARALSKALGGSQDGILVLNDSFGITRRNLKEAGAAIKSTGAISLDSASDLNKLALAIEKVAKQKNFTGNTAALLKTLSGNTSQLRDSAFKLAAAIGQSLIPIFVPLAQVATNVLTTIAGFNPVFLKVIGGATALGTAMAATGASMLAFKVALSGLPPLLGGLTTSLGTTAAGAQTAGAAFSGMLGPISLLATAVAGFLLLGFNESEQAAIELGKAIDQQSAAVSRTYSNFKQYRDAIAKATGASSDFVKVGQDTEDVIKKIRDALDGVSGDKLASELAKAGITSDDVKEDLEQSKKDLETFKKLRKDLEEAQKILEQPVKNSGGSLGNVTTDAARLGKLADVILQEFGETESVLNRIGPRIKQLDEIISQGGTNIGVLETTQKDLTATEKAFDRVITISKKQLGDLKIKADTDSLERSDQLLAETTAKVVKLKQIIGSLGSEDIDISSVEKIQDALASTPEKNIKQKEALQGLLDLIKERNKLQAQSATLLSKETKERVEGAVAEAKSLETADERIAALNAILARETNLGEYRKKINAEIRREEKTANGERVSEALFEANQAEGSAQKKIDALKRVLSTYELEGNVRRRILNDISRAEEQLEREREQRRKQEESALSGEYVRQQELIIQAIDERISKLREEADAGKEVSAELSDALQDRTEKEVALIQYQTKQRADAAESAKVAAQIEATGELEVEAARRKGIDAIEDQQKAQDDRIKKIREERKEALKGIADEEKARDQAAQKSAQRQQASGGEDGKAQGPGQSLSELADELAAIFSPEAGRARAEEIREENRGADARRQASFADANPAVADRVLAEDERRRKRIADIDQKRQEAAAKAAQEREKKVAKLQDSANERALEASRFDAQGRNEAIARFNEGGSDGRVLAAQAALETTKPIQVEPVATQAIQGAPLVTKAFSESGSRVATEGGTSAARPSGPQEWIIGVRFEDQPNVSDIKEVKRPRGIDGGQSQLERTLNGFNLRATI